MKPQAFQASGPDIVDRLLRCRGDARCLDMSNGQLVDGGALDVAIGIVGIKLVALADLNNVGVRDEGTVNALPNRQQSLAAARRERQVHAGGAAEPRGRVVIPGVEEIAVPVDGDEAAPPRWEEGGG